MAKTPKLKADPSSNPRSRAARHRATSPSANTPKSLEALSRAADSTPTLAPKHISLTNAGITKKRQRGGKKQTRHQRLRQEKVFARAEDVLGKLERKKEVGLKREKVGRERRRGWEEVNGVKRRDGGATNGGTGEGKEMEGDGLAVEDEWEDEADVNAIVETRGEERENEGISTEAKSVDLEVQADGLENEDDKIT